MSLVEHPPGLPWEPTLRHTEPYQSRTSNDSWQGAELITIGTKNIFIEPLLDDFYDHDEHIICHVITKHRSFSVSG